MNTHNVFQAFLVSDKFEEIDEFNHDIDLDFDSNGSRFSACTDDVSTYCFVFFSIVLHLVSMKMIKTRYLFIA